MTARVEREKAEWEKLKGSRMKKLFKRDFDDRVVKEEEEDIEALDWQRKARIARELVEAEVER